MNSLIKLSLPLFPVLVPLLALSFPGLALVHKPKNAACLPAVAARVILWSLSILSLTSLALISFGLPPVLALVLGLFFFLLKIIISKPFKDPAPTWLLLTFLVPALAIYAVFSAPFLLIHDGLPTGDSQKSIFWAGQILNNNSLPDYSLSAPLLNRDPVDFYTPALHTFTAMVIQAVPFSSNFSTLPLTAVGFLSICFAVATAAIALATAQLLYGRAKFNLLLLVSPFLILTNFRFLRYLREPGYHYQNVIGELLIIGLLFLFISLIQRWRSSDFILFVLCGITLLLTHQFSAFLAAFIFLAICVVMLLIHRRQLLELFSRHPYAGLSFILIPLAAILLALSLGLQSKLSHIFTASPHLLKLTPAPAEIFLSLGVIFTALGLFSLIYLYATRPSQAVLVFCVAATVLLILSQGPRLGIDIPPVRTLFYSVVPLSVAISLFFISLRKKVSPQAFVALLTLTIFIPASISTAKAFTLSHDVRTNSTMLPQYTKIISFIHENKSSGAVLIDDYNRRSSSWLVLSGKPMFARLASGILRQMEEASQSAKRKELYLKQLDFEKIYALGSLPEIRTLLYKHNISFIVGASRSSAAAFQRNVALYNPASGFDIELFQVHDLPVKKTNLPDDIIHWLLRPSTLANDIGDDEDTYKHLPASLRSTRLSPPLSDGHRLTYRTTTAPIIPLAFNVGNFVSAIWDQEKTNYPDSSLEFLIVAPNLAGSLTLSTPTGATYQIKSRQLTKINARDVPFDHKGIITLNINNPRQSSIDIDLIALGQSRTP